MNTKGFEFFDDVLEIHNANIALKDKYARMRSLLERITTDLVKEEKVKFPNLFSRLSYICKKLNFTQRYQIDSFRVRANSVLHAPYHKPNQNDYLCDLKSICVFIKQAYKISIPNEVEAMYKTARQECSKAASPSPETIRIVRVVVDHWDNDYLYVFDNDHPTEEAIKVKYNIDRINSEFRGTISKLWEECILNLAYVSVVDGIYQPGLIILEPDYLVDISSLAECIKPYGRNPLNYLQGKLEARHNSAPILLGNAVNLFLDEFVSNRSENPSQYNKIVGKVFKNSPIEFSASSEINKDFFDKLAGQFENLMRIVNTDFRQQGMDINNAMVEPSFICEQLGIQGRLDLLQLGKHPVVVELKSGKSGFPETNLTLIADNHKAQAFLYQILLQYVLNVRWNDLKTYILYSKYPNANLRFIEPYMAAIREVLNIRNLIVAMEHEIAISNGIHAAHEYISKINPNELISDDINQKFREMIEFQIINFQRVFTNTSPLEQEYFYSFFTFAEKEQYLSKTKQTTSWLEPLSEKLGKGQIMIDLEIEEIRSDDDKDKQLIEFRATNNNEPTKCYKFREGDIVIFYERNKDEDNVTNKQVFKGIIDKLLPDSIRVQMYHRQRNENIVFKRSCKYAIELDYMDSSFNNWYKGLFSFLEANDDRKQLILAQRPPRFDTRRQLNKGYSEINAEINELVLGAKQANDYYIIIGPPGTGKTSIALKSLVEEFHSDGNANILLLAYTNRAVDEICDALNKIEGDPDFIRIGQELNCSELHRDKLLTAVIADCDNRQQVRKKITDCRIFVATTSSLLGKMDLFKLKHFDVAIIDEASQLIEPQIIGLLSAKDSNGDNAIGKFILIGDYKQLPAVVTQPVEASIVESESLKGIGLSDRRNSLFERLYKFNKKNGNTQVYSTLRKQGRMHDEIFSFTKYITYAEEEIEVAKEWQEDIPDNNLETTIFKNHESNDKFEELLSHKRNIFISSEKNHTDCSNNRNPFEATVIAKLLETYHHLCKKNNLKIVSSVRKEKEGELSIGIIAPYRNQIALIKQKILELKISELENITIDTIERYQGSQRDIILYSCSVNRPDQMEFLSDLIEDDGQKVDRKLNVAITRAKNQFIIIGNASVLSENPIYFYLIDHIRSKDGFVDCDIDDFNCGNFYPRPNWQPEYVFRPERVFESVFDSVVKRPILDDIRTHYPDRLYGKNIDFIRLKLLECGMADFSNNMVQDGITLEQRINLYCYYNMRMHYLSALALYNGFNDLFKKYFDQTMDITFFDFGCGPATAGLAFRYQFRDIDSSRFNYVGIDISRAMLIKAEMFIKSFNKNIFNIFELWEQIPNIKEEKVKAFFDLPSTIVFNFSYFFGNVYNDEAAKLADFINKLIELFPTHKYVIICQNTTNMRLNASFNTFKKLLPSFRSVITSMPASKCIKYSTKSIGGEEKLISVLFDILTQNGI